MYWLVVISRRSFSSVTRLCRAMSIWAHRFFLSAMVCAPFLVLQRKYIQNHGRKLLPRPPRNQGQSKQYHQLKQPRNKTREAPAGRSYRTANGGFSHCFLFAQRFESPHITKMAVCISISTDARFCPLKRLKPLPQQGFQVLHLFQQH